MSGLLKTGFSRKTAMERLEERSIPCPASGCLLWTARVSGQGYGRLGFGGKNWRAHRLSWTITKGPIPKGLVVCHKCDVPACINPDHLFLGTHLDNMADMSAKHRRLKEAMPRPRNKGTGRIVKLDASRVRQILLDHRKDQEVADDHSVSRRLINLVRKREIWRHVPDPREMVGR